MKIRLNKWLAEQGVASRRAIDGYIEQGRIQINGQTVVELGTKVDPELDQVSVDGKPVVARANIVKRYFAFYKPKNVITTMSDPEGRPCVGDYVQGLPYRLIPIGRLDYDAEGLLLLSNDGDLMHRMMHPSFGHHRIYRTKVKGFPTNASVVTLLRGVQLDDGFAKFESAQWVVNSFENSWFEVAVSIGRYHIVKRLWEHVDHPVLKLIRTQYGQIKLGDLEPGEMRELTPEEVESCR